MKGFNFQRGSILRQVTVEYDDIHSLATYIRHRVQTAGSILFGDKIDPNLLKAEKIYILLFPRLSFVTIS